MGTLISSMGNEVFLPSRLLVGRSPAAELRLLDDGTSLEHCVLSWGGAAWHLRDLGSSNGTRVNDQPVRAGEQRCLRPGDRIRFGVTAERWELCDDSAPTLFARGLPDGPLVHAVDSVLELPRHRKPEAQVFPGRNGRWVLNTERGDMLIEDQSVIRLADQDFRVFLPAAVVQTRKASPSDDDDVRLSFRVSQDQETVVVDVESRGRSQRMESRAHNYILLQLARQRLQDVARPPEVRGWITRARLCRQVGLEAAHLNVQLFRLRRAMAELGLPQVAHLVECRMRPSELRLKVDRVSIQSLD